MTNIRWTFIAMASGQCWKWMHSDDEYQPIAPHGIESVRVYYRVKEEHRRKLIQLPDNIGDWFFDHSRELHRQSPESIAEAIYGDLARATE
jgi:hypothetical protein